MSGPTRNALRFSEPQSQQIEAYILPSSSQNEPRTSSFNKPFVTLTFATSLDSQLAIAPGVQTALSGPQSKAMTHFLRSRHDAILIGAGTAVADNPSLNCRIEGVGGYGGEGLIGQPRPVVIDPKGRWVFTAESKVLKLAEEQKGKAPIIITCFEPSAESREILERVGGKFLLISSSADAENVQRLDWQMVFEALSEEGIKSVMIEGGGFIINDLLGPGIGYSLIDSIIVTIAPTWLGKGGVQICPDRKTTTLPVTRLKDVRWIPLGEDVVLCGRPNLSLR